MSNNNSDEMRIKRLAACFKCSKPFENEKDKFDVGAGAGIQIFHKICYYEYLDNYAKLLS